MLTSRIFVIAFTIILVSSLVSLNASIASGDVTIQFEEAAPKDRFIIKNKSGCDLPSSELTIDLNGTPVGLFFDTAEGGIGENVAQPLEVAKGSEFISAVPVLADGARVLQLNFAFFPKNAQSILTVDIDDSIASGPRGVQMIADGEFYGAKAALETNNGKQYVAKFNNSGFLSFALPKCSKASS